MTLKQIFADGTQLGAVDPASPQGRLYLDRLKAVGYDLIAETGDQITMSQREPLQRVDEMRHGGEQIVAGHWFPPPANNKPDPAANNKPDPASLGAAWHRVIEQGQQRIIDERTAPKPEFPLGSEENRVLSTMKQGSGAVKILDGRLTDAAYTRVAEQVQVNLIASGDVVADGPFYVLPAHKKPVQEMSKAKPEDLGYDKEAGQYSPEAIARAKRAGL